MKQLLEHPLNDSKAKWAAIGFISEKDGREMVFQSYVNRLTGDRLTSFNNNPPSINDGIGWVRSVIRNIKSKCEIKGMIGNIK